jgi:hypothetical protein
MPVDSQALAPQRTAGMPANKPVTQSIAGLQDNAALTFAIIFLAYAMVGWFLLFSDWAWFHVELFGVSEYIWSGPRANSVPAKLGALLDWRTFDVSPYRLRTVSDFVEIIDAATRPAMRAVWGMHPSATLLGFAMAAVIPVILYATLRRLGLGRVHAALIVLLLTTTIGFLSCFVAYIRPAKRLALLGCCLVPHLCLLLQTRASKPVYFALMLTLLMGFFADETGYILLPIAIVLLLRPMLQRRGYLELAGFVALLLLFILLARFVLPYVYLRFGTSGSRAEVVSGQLVFKLLGYLIEPGFYRVALDDLATSALASLGILDASKSLVIAFIGVFFAVMAGAGFLYLRASGARATLFWNLLTISVSLILISFFLTLFDWFNNPFASNYIGALTFYYHSAVAIFAVLWLACVYRTGLVMLHGQGRLVFGGVSAACIALVAVLNFLNFEDINRLFQILHTYPLDAKALVGTPWRANPGLEIDRDGRTIRFSVRADPDATAAEYESLVKRSIGPRTGNFLEALAIYKRGPIGTDQFVQRYVHLFYPTYTISASVPKP